jgi:hypothetical protein
MYRRQFLASTAAALAVPASAQRRDWQSGTVRHILPTASDRRILLKASFTARHNQPPLLRIGKRVVAGRPTCTAGIFWSFDAPDLAPDTGHELQLLDARRKPLCDPWPLRTFPARDARPGRFRLLVYTCAGGDERAINARGRQGFLTIERRRRMFQRALSFQPDAIAGNGDHIYWDLRQTGAPPNARPELLKETGVFQRTEPVFGTPNEEVLKRVGDAQIGRLYGTLFRSVPVFFTQDDHDYFENDDADQRMVTFPPDHFMLQLGRGTRRLYFPEFLPDADRPLGLPGSSAPDTPPGSSESYGTIRYGSLAEILLYDCRRHLSLAGPNAWIVPPETEQWLTARMAAAEPAHVVNLPSMPPVWSAGKWGDWYPDILDAEGNLTTKIAKPYWQEGWARQHDRLMQACSSMNGRIPLFLSGDMHAHGEARVLRAGTADLSRNPVNVFLSGAISTLNGWPSMARQTPPKPSTHVEVDLRQPALEENGFLIVDFEPEGITVHSWKWTPAVGDDRIEELSFFRETRLARPG